MNRVGILIFDDVELLDFCGPYEVFSSANRVARKPVFEVFTIAQKRTITSNNGLVIQSHHLLSEAPSIDLLLVPGGRGTRQEQDNPILIAWIAERAEAALRVMSVCTGVFLLVKAGLVEGLTLTTHGSAFEELAEIAPANPLDREARFLDHGGVVISAGISAGIDMAFSVLCDQVGEAHAREAARYMEYDWRTAS